MKKLVSLILAVLVVLGFSGCRVGADSDYEYIIDNGTVTITGYKGDNANIVIPGKIEGKKVTEIG